MNKCLERGYHVHDIKSDTGACECGQVPLEIFFCPGCNCAAGHDYPPVHEAGCKLIKWMKLRNSFIEHNKPRPPLEKVNYKVKEVA